MNMPEPTSELARIVTRFDGQIGYLIKNLESGAELSDRADELFPTASAIKWPLLSAFHEYVRSSATNWDDVVDARRLPMPSGSGVLSHLSSVVELSYRDAAWLMICVSDNLATNLLLDAMGIETANAIMHRIVGPGLAVLRPAGFGTGAIGDTMGRATPRALARHVELLAQNKLVGAGDTLSVASSQFYRGGLARYIPEPEHGSPAVAIASKGGSMPSVRVDTGLLESAGTTIAAAVMIDRFRDQGYGVADPAQQCIGDMARSVLRSWAGPDVAVW